MIRVTDGHTAFGDLHDFFMDRRDGFLDWMQTAVRAAEGVLLSQAAVQAVERKLGRDVTQEVALAIAWVVNVCIDIEHQVRTVENEAGLRSVTQIAYDNAVAMARTRAIQDFTKLPPHAVAQLSAVLTHIDNYHL